ncbi:unnamed protein product [Brachionus calyciflorus]|uniref:Leucine-rich repeat-containing protein 71 n=1 Tax=Brachionus calyciflorus TaxID=104777 RepID=A0A813RPV6_9BILA|nr:unnamed protein product [Brachionus calyciflorus]
MASKSKNSTPANKLGTTNNLNLNNMNKQGNMKNSTEPMKCTGKFKDDFDTLCQLKSLKFQPEVISRSKRPGSAIQNSYLSQGSGDVGQKGDKKSVNTNKKQATTANSINMDTEHESEQNPEFIDLPPKSFVIKDSAEYFKPKIHVEMDNPDKLDSVTEIHIKGWKLEKPIIEILNLCLPSIDQLHTLNLWAAGLDEEAVRLISSMLPNCSNLKTLILDNNPIQTPIYHVLLYEENSNVQNLSLRNNKLGDIGVQYLSCALGELKRSNTKLLSLNLNTNSIGDEGAKHLAKALRTNRALLVLNLANNQIGDEGANALSEVISKFPMTFEEIKHRRYVMSGRTFEKSTSPSSRKGTENKEKEKLQNKRTSEMAATLQPQNNQGQNQKNPKEGLNKPKKDDKNARKASVNDLKLGKSIKPLLKTGKRSTKDLDDFNESDDYGNEYSTRLKNLAFLDISPLTDIAEYIDENLCLLGNRTLLSLNLSRNELTEKGVNSFLLAISYQKTFMELHKSQGTGLLRLILTNNGFSPDYENYIKLVDLVKQRDPVNKSTNGLLNDTESVKSGKDSSLGRKSGNNRH